MEKVITATYDGAVLIPDEKLNLAPNTKLKFLIKEILKCDYPLDIILKLSEETGIEDLSSNHDKYINKAE